MTEASKKCRQKDCCNTFKVVGLCDAGSREGGLTDRIISIQTGNSNSRKDFHGGSLGENLIVITNPLFSIFCVTVLVQLQVL